MAHQSCDFQKKVSEFVALNLVLTTTPETRSVHKKLSVFQMLVRGE